MNKLMHVVDAAFAQKADSGGLDHALDSMNVS